MKVLITGGGGQLARQIADAFREDTVECLGRSEFDITDAGDGHRAFSVMRPDVLINTAAFNQVDVCEKEPELAFRVNAAAVQRLAALCTQHGTLIVHFSTDYVFAGERSTPYVESDPVAPINTYGASKAAGEMAVRATAARHLIIRTAAVFGPQGRSRRSVNFVDTMLRLGGEEGVVRVVEDQVMSPTYTVDLAAMTQRLVQSGGIGTYHVTNTGACSWFELAAEVFRLAALPAQLEPISQAQRSAAARRPAYSVLAHQALQRDGIQPLRHWREALADYLHARMVS